MKEDAIDALTNHSWRTRSVYRESHTFTSYYRRGTGCATHLQHRQIKQFNSTLGDSLEIWDGSNWEDWISTKSEGRGQDYWMDYEQGVIYAYRLFTLPADVRVTYRFGPPEAICASITDSATTMAVDSTAGFPVSGILRIDSEDIMFSGKTTTTFTGLTRGVNGTTAATHTSAIARVIPGDIEEACVKMVAAELLRSEFRTMLLPEGTEHANYSALAEKWMDDAARILQRRKEFAVTEVPLTDSTYWF
jgi:hypothetical protein